MMVTQSDSPLYVCVSKRYLSLTNTLTNLKVALEHLACTRSRIGVKIVAISMGDRVQSICRLI
jgi:hypothetical protein